MLENVILPSGSQGDDGIKRVDKKGSKRLFYELKFNATRDHRLVTYIATNEVNDFTFEPHYLTHNQV